MVCGLLEKQLWDNSTLSKSRASALAWGDAVVAGAQELPCVGKARTLGDIFDRSRGLASKLFACSRRKRWRYAAIETPVALRNALLDGADSSARSSLNPRSSNARRNARRASPVPRGSPDRYACDSPNTRCPVSASRHAGCTRPSPVQLPRRWQLRALVR